MQRKHVLAILGCIVGLAFAAEAAAPTVWTDFLTGKEVDRLELIRRSAFSPKIDEVLPGRPGHNGNLREGDVIVAVQGTAVIGMTEFRSVLFRKGTPTNVTISVCRDGEIVSLSLATQDPERPMGVHLEPRNRAFVDLLLANSVPLTDSEQQVLHGTPARVAAEVAAWIKAQPGGSVSDRDWLVRYIAQYSAILDQNFQGAVTAVGAVPIPFLRRMSLFYASIAQRNKDGEKEPDWKGHGESLEFYSTYYPVPRFIVSPVGKIQCGDERFNKLLSCLLRNSDRERAQRRDAATAYALESGKSGLVNRFLNIAKAAVLDPHRYGGEYENLWRTIGGTLTGETVADALYEISANPTNASVALMAALAAHRRASSNWRNKSGQSMADVARELYGQSPYLGVFANHFALVAAGDIYTTGEEHYMHAPADFSENFLTRPSLFCQWIRKRSLMVGSHGKLSEHRTGLWIDSDGRLSGMQAYLALNPRLIKEAFEPDPDTLLCDAVRRLDLADVERAFALGANPNTKQAAVSQLMLVRSTSGVIARALIRHGAKIDDAMLYVSCPAVIEALIDAGVDVNCRRAEDGQTPLMNAAQSGYVDTVIVFLKHGARMDLKDHDGKTALDCAKRYGFGKPAAEYLQAVLDGRLKPGDPWVPATPVKVVTGSESCRVSVSTVPPRAELWIDKVMVGLTPCTATVDKAAHEVKVSKRWFDEYTWSMEITGEPEKRIPPMQLTRQLGSIEVDARVSGVDDRQWRSRSVGLLIGQGRWRRVSLPYVEEWLPGGAWFIDLRVPGYRVVKADGVVDMGAGRNAVVIDGGRTNRCVFTIEPDQTVASNLTVVAREPPELSTSVWTNSLGMEFVPVPRLKLLCCRWKTSVGDYDEFCRATGRNWPSTYTQKDLDRLKRFKRPASWEPAGVTRPATFVTWIDANAFCDWLTRREVGAGVLKGDQRYRLPSGREWDLAAGRKNTDPDAPTYSLALKSPDGREYEPLLTTWECFTYKTSPAGFLGTSRNGIADLLGNAREWCSDTNKIPTDKNLRKELRDSLLHGETVAVLRSSVPQTEKEIEFYPIRSIAYGGGLPGGFRCVLDCGGDGPTSAMSSQESGK